MTLAKRIFAEQEIEAGRYNEFTWAMYLADGITPEAITGSDVIRFKLYDATTRELLLDIDTVDGSAASRVTIVANGTAGSVPASGKIIIDQAATDNDDAGLYWGELILVDASDSNKAKPFGRGKMRVVPSAEGDLGAT